MSKTIQMVCMTDTEYNRAKQLQATNDAIDPKHEKSDRIIVIDCRTQHN